VKEKLTHYDTQGKDIILYCELLMASKQLRSTIRLSEPRLITFIANLRMVRLSKINEPDEIKVECENIVRFEVHMCDVITRKAPQRLDYEVDKMYLCAETD